MKVVPCPIRRDKSSRIMAPKIGIGVTDLLWPVSDATCTVVLGFKGFRHLPLSVCWYMCTTPLLIVTAMLVEPSDP